MHTQSDEGLMCFKIGDVVRVIGKPQLLTIIECRAGMAHVHIETTKTIHYKCEWHQRDGHTYTKWYDGNSLEKIR